MRETKNKNERVENQRGVYQSYVQPTTTQNVTFLAPLKHTQKQAQTYARFE